MIANFLSIIKTLDWRWVVCLFAFTGVIVLLIIFARPYDIEDK